MFQFSYIWSKERREIPEGAWARIHQTRLHGNQTDIIRNLLWWDAATDQTALLWCAQYTLLESFRFCFLINHLVENSVAYYYFGAHLSSAYVGKNKLLTIKSHYRADKADWQPIQLCSHLEQSFWWKDVSTSRFTVFKLNHSCWGRSIQV